MISGTSGNQLDAIQMDFVARRYDTFSETFSVEYYDDDQILQEVDLTGATAQMQLKKRKSDATAFFNMDVAISGNDIIVSKNHIAMDIPKGKYWYDIEIKDSDGNHITWVEGRFVVIEHVTQYVDTVLTYIWTTIDSVLNIFDVPKTTIMVYLKSILSFVTGTVFWIKTIFKVSIEFIGLNFIIKEYINKFVSTVGIYTVPKTIFATVFRLIVSMTTNIYYYSTNIWSTNVTFHKIG